jgi:cell division protein ZapA
MNQKEVQIMGQSYVLSFPAGGEEAMQAAASKVDEAMCRIRDVGKIKARDRIAVLAALNLAAGAAASAPPLPATPAVMPALPVASEVAVAPVASPALLPNAASAERLRALRMKLDLALRADGQLI